MKRSSRGTIPKDLTFAGDPGCCHCAILYAMQQFSEAQRGGAMETGEMIHSLLHVVVDILNQAPNPTSRRAVEDYVVEELDTHGFHVMRIEGERQ